MLNFFKHIKFWGPLVIVTLLFLVMELILRAGVWDNKIKPLSYLGHGVYRAKTMQDHGLEKINWVAVGNSVLDWGLNHQDIRSQLHLKGVEYARMTMGSSKFPTVQMVSDWSINQMAHLDGLIIGSSASALGSYHLSTQYKVSWPFLSAYDDEKYRYDALNSPLKIFYQKLALFIYFDDIKDYLVNYKKRTTKVNKNYMEADRILNFNISKPNHVCGYEIDTLKACIETANGLRKQEKTTRFEREIIRRCPVKATKKQLKLNSLRSKLKEESITFYADNWSKFIASVAQRNKQVKFLILPELPLVQFTTKPRGMDDVLNRVVNSITNLPQVEVHDLRNLFSHHQTYQPCEMFNDGIHLNDVGKSVLTRYVLSTFE